MIDVDKGKERIRAWPKARGKNIHPINREWVEWFREAQWMCKYMAPQQQWACTEARAGTPLLPRDVMTMIMANRMFAFSTTKGVKYYPMTARQDVSESLDVLAQMPGMMLYRGADWWQWIEPGAGGQVLTWSLANNVPEWQPAPSGGGGSWEVLETGTITGATSFVQFDDLAGYSDLLLIGRNLTTTTSHYRTVSASQDDFTTQIPPADLRLLSGGGVEGATDWLGYANYFGTAARTVTLRITGNKPGADIMCQSDAGTTLISAQANPINSLRLWTTLGGYLGSGTYSLQGKP